MARLSEQALQDRERASELSWEDLDVLWSDLQSYGAVEWASGKALEHLVVRGFSLSGLVVEYPYDVPLGGRPLEQIDGLVYLGEVPFLIECKDRDSVDIEAIARLRNQLLRRPPSTMGCVFVSGTFTRPAIILSDFAAPHRITLWSTWTSAKRSARGALPTRCGGSIMIFACSGSPTTHPTIANSKPMPRTSKLSVVVEGPSDAVLLRRLLSRAASLQPKFYAGGGRLALATLARNVLVHEGGPLLVVMDADTADSARAAEACAMTQAALRQVAADQSFAVFAFVPQLEVVFFEAYPMLQGRLGADALSAGPMVGRLAPRRTLQSALEREGIPREAFFRSLTESDLDLLLKGPQLRALVASVLSLVGSQGGVLGSAA